MLSIVRIFLLVLGLTSATARAAEPAFTQLPPEQWPQISAINDAPFQREQFAGNGFLLEYRGKRYAVTAKHVFLLIKSDKVSSIELDADLIAKWSMHPYGDPQHRITLGPLRNADPNERIDVDIVDKDWLFFDVAQDTSGLKPLHLRTSPLQPGEKLFVAGCAYLTAEHCRQNIATGVFVALSGPNLLVDMGPSGQEPHRFSGLSGAPVVDAQGDVVGLVSNEKPNPNGKGILFAPASTAYAIETLNRLQ